MSELIDVALEMAWAILASECSQIGLMASPEGYPHQAWSAGMYVFAHHSVADNQVPIFIKE
jgi:glycogen debranching enzyme